MQLHNRADTLAEANLGQYGSIEDIKIVNRAKTNILNESERITFTTNEYSNILQVFSIKLLP